MRSPLSSCLASLALLVGTASAHAASSAVALAQVGQLSIELIDLDLTDGIKVFNHGGWAQVLPDPDEPLVHVFAEGDTDEATGALAAEMRGLVESVLEEDPAAPGRRLESQV